MKTVCCDTSFLMSLYVIDTHTPAAVTYLRKLQQPLTISVFNQFEIEQAFHLAVWRKLIPPSDCGRYLASFDRDCQSLQLIVTPVDLAAILKRSRQLSQIHTSVAGHRSLDILHVAAALEFRADHFLSFDTNQRKLARAEGLKLNP